MLPAFGSFYTHVMNRSVARATTLFGLLAGVCVPHVYPQATTGGGSLSIEAPMLDQARKDLDNGRAHAAELLVSQFLLQNPDSAQGHFLMGFALFREIQTHAPEAADLAHVTRHDAFLGLREKNARASLAQYTEGARYGKPSAFDLKIVALDYVLLGDQADADKWLTKSLQWDPSDEQGWYYEGRIRYKQARYTEAVQAFQQALHLDAHNVRAEDNLGLAYERLGKTDEAVGVLQQAVAWEGPDAKDDAPQVDLGDVLVQHGRSEQALPSLLQAVAMSPQDLRAHETLAAAYRNLQRWPEAEAELQKAVSLSPNDASLHFMLGQAYRRTGQSAKANTEMQQSAALEAQDESAARATARDKVSPQ